MSLLAVVASKKTQEDLGLDFVKETSIKVCPLFHPSWFMPVFTLLCFFVVDYDDPSFVSIEILSEQARVAPVRRKKYVHVLV